MSLEDLKNDWEEIEESISQNKIPSEQIKSILKSKYRAFLRRVFLFDLFLLFVYGYFIALITFHYSALEINQLEILAVVCLVILALLFITGVIKLTNTFRNDFLNYSPARSIKGLAKQKVNVQKFYLLNIISGFILTIILFILNIKIYNEYNLITNPYFWLIIIPCSLLFIVLINTWIKRYYIKVTREAKELLQELE